MALTCDFCFHNEAMARFITFHKIRFLFNWLMFICYAGWKGGIAKKIDGKVLGNPGPNLDLDVKENNSDLLHQLPPTYSVALGWQYLINLNGSH